MNNQLSINKIAVAEKDGLFSLTDLHTASGGIDIKRPSRWLRLKRTKDLITELSNDLSEVIKSNKKAGSFGCQELVVAYAMYISPAFEVAVIRAFLKDAQAKLRQADLHGKAEWHQNRELGKLTHRDNADTIKDFISYATAQGSQGYQKNGYTIITNMVNRALGIDDRDNIDEQQLHLLATAELICDLALERGMAEGLPYKSIYKQAKHDVELFTSLAMIKTAGKKEAPASEQIERDLDNEY